MKIGNINNTTKLTSFKNTLTKKEFNEIKNQQKINSYKKQDKIGILSGAAGLTVGAVAKLSNAKNPLTKGIYGYFATLFTLFGLSAIKSALKDEEINLGSEEKNKEYKRLEKENADENLKYIYAPLIATSTLSTIATAIVCFAKNIPNKMEKIKVAPLLTVMPSLLASTIFLGVKASKESDKAKSS